MTEGEFIVQAASMGMDPNSPEALEYRMALTAEEKAKRARGVKYAPLVFGSIGGAAGGIVGVVIGGLLLLEGKKVVPPTVAVGTLLGVGYGLLIQRVAKQTGVV